MSSRPVIHSIASVQSKEVDRARGATIQVLLGPDDGATNFITRCFTLSPGGRIPRHRHDVIEHAQVMLDGEMVIGLNSSIRTVRAGDCLFIPPGVSHWYENRSRETARFLCIVPATADYGTEWLEDAPS
jgi:quercetin dioxygenase-like cupin family protein